jgi:hypothetical protein
LHNISSRKVASYEDSPETVTGNYIPCADHSPTNVIVGGIENADPILRVAQIDRARYIRSDEVTLHQVSAISVGKVNPGK